MASVAYTTIKSERVDKVMVVRLNRPDRMNAVNETMYREIQDVLKGAEGDSEVRVCVITGSVLKRDGIEKQAFCAGADLKAHASGTRDKAARRAYIELAHETTKMLYTFPKPVVAAVNGPARGAGLEMALNCDFILMADDATLAFSETGLGTFVGGGVTSHLPVLVGMAKAKELMYTCRVIDGKKAVSTGLALQSVPVDRLMEATLSLAGDLSEKAPVSIRLAKEMLRNSRFHDIETVLKNETEAILSCMETEDWHEGIASFMQKRKPIFKGK